MAWLDNLKFIAKGGYGKGNWGGLPELGLTETFAGGKTQSVLNASGYNKTGGTTSRVPTTQNTPRVLGLSGTGGTGAYVAPKGTAEPETGLQDIADNGKSSRIQGIKDRLGMIRDMVNRQVGTAGQVRDDLKSSIANTYGGLKTSAQNKVGTALENLGQERTGVYNTYGTAKGESRRALESALTKNRMLARSMNRLNSSFYDDRQAEATETGARDYSGLSREEAGKVAGIGTRETETKNWGEQTALQIEQEQANLITQADQEYSQRVNEAMDMERSFGIDSEEQLREAETEYQSKLNAISQYVENKGLRIAEIMATAGITGAGIDSFSAYTPELQNLLGNKQSLTSAQSSEIPTFANVTTGGGSMANINQNQTTSALDELYRKLGLRFA